MKTAILRVTLMLAAFPVTAASPAAAADSDKATGWYVKGDGGVSLLEGTSITYANGAPEVKLNTGYRAGLMGGYNFSPLLGAEFETGIIDNSVNDGSNGQLRVVPTLINVVLRYEKAGKFVPYISGGLGGCASILRTRDSSSERSYFNFAYQAKAGLAYKITEHALVDVSYKFFSGADEDFGSFKVSHYYSHFIGAGFTWRF